MALNSRSSCRPLSRVRITGVRHQTVPHGNPTRSAAPCTFHGGGTESQRDKEACSWHPAKKRSFRDWTTSLPVSSTRFRVPGWSRCWKDNERQRQQQTLDYTGAGAHTCDLSTGESQAGGPLELQASWAIAGNPLKIRT